MSDPKLPGRWLVDLSHVDLSKGKVGKEWVELDSSLLPSPFAPKGDRPKGPAWDATPTVAYAAGGPSPLDFLPYRQGKPLPGGFKLGINPGLVKHEGTQSVLWGEGVREQHQTPELNLARYIKDTTVTDADNGE